MILQYVWSPADQADFIMRIIMMVFFLFFTIHLMILRKKSIEVPTKQNFYLLFAMFFFFTFLNFLFTEIDLQLKKSIAFDQNILISDVTDSIYPAVILPGMTENFVLTRPVNSDIYLIILILLSLTPMLYAVEKNILQKKTPIVLLDIICLILFLGMIGLNALGVSGSFFNMYINYSFVFGWVMLIFTGLRVVYVYLKLAISSVGEIRALGALMSIGLVFMILGLLLTSTISDLTDFSEIIGHGIQLGGLVLIFVGVMKMQ